jgi:hypothetical protein
MVMCDDDNGCGLLEKHHAHSFSAVCSIDVCLVWQLYWGKRCKQQPALRRCMIQFCGNYENAMAPT